MTTENGFSIGQPRLDLRKIGGEYQSIIVHTKTETETAHWKIRHLNYSNEKGEWVGCPDSRYCLENIPKTMVKFAAACIWSAHQTPPVTVWEVE